MGGGHAQGQGAVRANAPTSESAIPVTTLMSIISRLRFIMVGTGTIYKVRTLSRGPQCPTKYGFGIGDVTET